MDRCCSHMANGPLGCTLRMLNLSRPVQITMQTLQIRMITSRLIRIYNVCHPVNDDKIAYLELKTRQNSKVDTKLSSSTLNCELEMEKGAYSKSRTCNVE